MTGHASLPAACTLLGTGGLEGDQTRGLGDRSVQVFWAHLFVSFVVRPWPSEESS